MIRKACISLISGSPLGGQHLRSRRELVRSVVPTMGGSKPMCIIHNQHRLFSTSGNNDENKEKNGSSVSTPDPLDNKNRTSANARDNKESGGKSTASNAQQTPIIDEKQIKEDRKLQDSYQGFLPRLFKALMLLKQSEQEKFDNLVRDKVILPTDFLVGSNLYVDLQHPLLIKYNFDPVDFNAGALEAFTQIRKAVAAMERHDELHCCAASTELLKASLNGPLFSLYMKAFEVMGKPHTRTIMKDLKVKSVIMSSVVTDIVNDDFYKTEEEIYKVLYKRVGGGLIAMKRGHVASIITPSGDRLPEEQATVEGSRKELNEEVLESWIRDIKVDRLYPHGSVVASVEVRFDSEETGVQIVGHGSEAKENDFQHKKSTVLGFQACISGQVPLDWLVVRMHVQSLR